MRSYGVVLRADRRRDMGRSRRILMALRERDGGVMPGHRREANERLDAHYARVLTYAAGVCEARLLRRRILPLGEPEVVELPPGPDGDVRWRIRIVGKPVD